MASYIDAATIVALGTALVIYQYTIGVTPEQIGILSGCLTLGIALGALLGGRLGDLLGRRRVFLATMLMVILGSALLVFADSFPLLLIGSALAGLGTGADLPVSLSTIAEAATEKNRGAIIGLSNILWMVGILGTIVIATVAGGWGRIGGQLLFAHIGVIAVLIFFARLSIPESTSWKVARDERRQGIATIRADRSSLRDLLRRPYLGPLAALLVFYSLANVAANTQGQFGAFLAVNIAGIPVQLNAALGLMTFPISLLFGVWFMRIIDGAHRMKYFVAGAVALFLGFLVPSVAGFSLVTIVVMNVLLGVGGAFAGEGIMKVWTQESFPTLLRTTAQGTIIATARIVAALVAFITPSLIVRSPQVFYGVLAALVGVGLLVGWLAFRGKRSTEFDSEGQLDPEGAAHPTSPSSPESPRMAPGVSH